MQAIHILVILTGHGNISFMLFSNLLAHWSILRPSVDFSLKSFVFLASYLNKLNV